MDADEQISYFAADFQTEGVEMNRRRFLKYGGALVIVGATAATAAYYDWYNSKVNEEKSKNEYVVLLVNEAANLIEREGEACFAEFRQRDSKWFHDDFYIFVWRTDGIRVVYPPDPGGEGEDMSKLEDVNGKPIGRLFIDIATSEVGEGWIDYEWPKPDETKPSKKHTYIKRAEFGTQRFLVGAGYYE